MRRPISSPGLLPGIALVLLSSRASAIRVEIEPMPFPRAVHELSRLFGAPVRIDKRLLRTTFVAYAPSTTPEELRAKIAEAFNATWTYWNGEWLLEQTETQILQEKAIAESRPVETGQLLIAYAKKAERRLEPYTNDVARLFSEKWNSLFRELLPGEYRSTNFYIDEDFSSIEEDLPPGRLLNRILARFKEEDFRGIHIGERRVFAWRPIDRRGDNPARLQRPLNFDPAKILANYSAEQRFLINALEKDPPQPGKEELLSDIGRVIEPDNMFVTIARTSARCIEVCLTLLDRQGTICKIVENNLWGNELAFGIDSDWLNKRQIADQKENLASVHSRDFRKLLLEPTEVGANSLDAYAMREPDLNLLERVRRVTQRDPFAVREWDLLKMGAKDRGASFVGELSDEIIGWGYGYLSASRTYPRSLETAKKGRERNKKPSEWILLRSLDRLSARQIYRNRRDMERFLNARSTGKYRNLVEILGDYAEANALVSWNNPLDSLVQRARFEDLPTDGVEPKYWPAYAEPGRRPPFGERWQPAFRNSAFWSRFYKGIAPMLPSIPAPDPTDIDVQELRVPQKTRALLEEVLFRSAIPEDILSNFLVRSGSEGGGFSAYGATAEPTLYFPNGLPDDVKFSASSKHRFRLVAEVQNSPKRRWVMGPQQLAEVVCAKSNPKGMKIKNIPVGFSLDRLYLYKQVRLQITIHLGPGFSATGQVEWHEPIGSKPVPLNLLPKEFQDAYKQELINIQGAPKR